MKPVPTRPLLPLPAQPKGVPWPNDGAANEWPEASPAELGADAGRLDALLDELVAERHPEIGLTYGVAVVAGGRLVAERYGQRVVRDLRAWEPDPPLEPVTPADELLSWSMAKSLTSLAVGVAVGDGRLRVDDPVLDPRWDRTDDPRAAITWDHLLTMRPGLAWTEEYYDLSGDELPNVVTMLYGTEAADMAAYAASFPLVHEPGSAEAFQYSSGTTNIIAANLQRVLGLDVQGVRDFLEDRIFFPLGMSSFRVDVDTAGTFVGSSYAYATLRDWCRFGLLAMRGGRWRGTAIVPDGWIDYSRRARSWDDDIIHGAHWWTWDQDQMPFGAHGFEGQRVICFPTRDVVVVRLGLTPSDGAPALNARITEIAGCFPELG